MAVTDHATQGEKYLPGWREETAASAKALWQEVIVLGVQ